MFQEIDNVGGWKHYGDNDDSRGSFGACEESNATCTHDAGTPVLSRDV